MRNKILFVALLVLAVSTYTVAGKNVSAIRSDYTYRLHASAIPLSPEVLKIIAGEFKGMAANYLLLEAASFIGSKEKGTVEDWQAVALLLDQSNTLDPYFRQTYRLAQSTLPWEADNVEQALVILERSRKELPWDWVPGFFMGFDHFYFLKDNLAASKKLMEASQIPEAPIALASWGSRLASRAGETETAIEFLKAVIEKTEDKKQKEMLRARVAALEGALILKAAVERFQVRYGRQPEKLEELVHSSIITSLPVNPYKRPYVLVKGVVEF